MCKHIVAILWNQSVKGRDENRGGERIWISAKGSGWTNGSLRARQKTIGRELDHPKTVIQNQQGGNSEFYGCELWNGCGILGLRILQSWEKILAVWSEGGELGLGWLWEVEVLGYGGGGRESGGGGYGGKGFLEEEEEWDDDG
ncbi:hypothetical protein RHMOL_Rhmol10G0082400 [Rhododendron molle]|uniref:Uncharacterized protein n=1 Tax=Rhododendron molle TaxID=49168 RepID=A0ACC0M018_RHOML|nr:hypothetical protein RHMOL_Rhmol10G0082400 [Rhododendron molle]